MPWSVRDFWLKSSLNNLNKSFNFILDFLVLLVFTYAVLAEDQIIEAEDDDVKTDVDSAQLMMMPMGGGGGCGNTCMCRQRCAMIWWMPCSCGPCNGCGCCDEGDQNTQPTTQSTTTTTTTTT